MKKLDLLKNRGFYCLLCCVPLLMGACNQNKSGETRTTKQMENMFDTSGAVGHMLLPEASPLSVVTQYIGITELTIRYNRPAMYNDSAQTLQKSIPYGEVWSPGHHMISKFSTSDSISIRGKTLPAGSYSLLMVPGEKTWTIVFNSDTLYDIRQYDQKNDVLRVDLDAQKGGFAKDLTFGFSEIQPGATVLCMNWGNVALRMPININNDKKVEERYESAFAKADKDDWHIYVRAANYCLEGGINLDKGIEWINKSIAIKENHTNTWTKAELYAAKADYKNAVLYGEKANELGKTEQNEHRQKHFDQAIAMWKQKADKK